MFCFMGCFSCHLLLLVLNLGGSRNHPSLGSMCTGGINVSLPDAGGMGTDVGGGDLWLARVTDELSWFLLSAS